MKRSFRVHLSDNFPWAVVPNRWIWDLVEYLALRRTRVTYTYSAREFIVSFPHMDLDQVQQLLTQWAENWSGSESSAADQEANISFGARVFDTFRFTHDPWNRGGWG
jgi:hypothetical protein